jgi:hypothetical protein
MLYPWVRDIPKMWGQTRLPPCPGAPYFKNAHTLGLYPTLTPLSITNSKLSLFLDIFT